MTCRETYPTADRLLGRRIALVGVILLEDQFSCDNGNGAHICDFRSNVWCTCILGSLNEAGCRL